MQSSLSEPYWILSCRTLGMSAHRLRRAVGVMLAVVLLNHVGTADVDGSDPSATDAFATTITPVIKAHCAQCHGGGDSLEGDLDLVKINRDDLEKDVDLLHRLIEVLDLKEMPPEDSPQPTAKARLQLVAELKTMLRESLSKTHAFSHAPIRRMNRFQYNNAVVDLFGLKCIVFTLPERMLREHKGYFKPESEQMAEVVAVGSRPLGKSQMIEARLAGVAAFPQDLRAEHGFDNRGDHLSLSPLLMESFLKLGQSITQSPDFQHKRVGIWKTFFAEPNGTGRSAEGNYADQIQSRLKPFLQRAFRRPVEETVLDRYSEFVLRQIESGVEFTDAMKMVAAATISSPRFLYLYDKATTSETAQRIDDLELASRMSFFLWGSGPDETLLELATAGTLKDPAVLDLQVDRMLKDHKLKRFCDSFPTQWLQLERIISSVPNRKHYPEFYFSKYRDSMHMMVEPLLLFETVLIENLPITQLIDSDFTYRSKHLESSYAELRTKSKSTKGNGGSVGVLNFHRVPVTDRRNGGVITNAAVMTMTSGPERTQPITRGAWVAGVIFNNPPEPPPADVPALGEKPAEGEEHLTLRERLALHRERSDCKGCHEQIDPLGFALENYNPIGVWRTKYGNDRDVDMAGELFRKHKFNDVIEFKDAILAEKDRFTRGLAGHLLSFALARELGAADQIALDQITEATAADDYKMKTLIKQVIFSEPFQSKTNPNAETGSGD